MTDELTNETVNDTTNRDELLVDINESSILGLAEKSQSSTTSNSSVLAILDGPVLDYVHPTANGRLYDESLCDKIKNSEHVVKMEQSNNFLGEPDHPDKRFPVRYSEVSHAIRNFRKEPSKGAYYATFDILDTPNGRILKTLLDYGTKLGVSSRGLGRSIVRKDGEVIVDPDHYKFSTFDIVVEPSNSINRLTANESTDNTELTNTTLMDSVNESITNKDIDSLKSLKPVLTFLVESSTPGYEKALSDVTKVINESESITNTPEVVKTDDLVNAYNEISSLEKKISSKDSIIDKSNGTIDKLNKQVESLSKLVENYESTNSELATKVSELSTELDSSTAKINKLNTKINESSITIDKYYKLIDTYNSTADDYNNLLDKYKECKLLLKSNSKQLTELKESYESKLECMNKELFSYVEELDEAHSKYFSNRCNQLGINESVAKSKFINESLSAYSLDEIDDKLRDIYKDTTSLTHSNLSESLELSPLKVVGTNVSPKVPNTLLREYAKDPSVTDDKDLDDLKSSISSVRNNLI